MTNAPRRLSDPESVLSQIEEARKAFGDLAGLVEELAAARGRLEILESRLHALGETTVQLNDVGATTVATVQREAESLGQRASEAFRDLANDRVNHDAQVAGLLREAHRALDELMEGVRGAIDGSVSRSDEAVSAATTARTELTSAFEQFRREQLTKLEDVSTSHRLLSDRQRESEAGAQRRHDELARRVDAGLTDSRQEVGVLRDRVSDVSQGLHELQAAMDAGRIAQSEEIAEVRAEHRTQLAKLRRSTKLQLLLVAIPSVAALVGVIALAASG